MPPVPGSIPEAPLPPTSAAPTISYTPASAGRRLANYVIDIIGTGIWSYLFGFIQGLLVPSTTAFAFLVGILAFLTYYMFFEGIWQRSPGKYVTRTKVVALDGSKPDFAHIVGRSFARLVPFEPLSFLLSSHPIGWHDRWTGTLVVPNEYNPEQVQKIAPSPKRSVASIVIVIVVAVFIGIIVIGLLASIVLSSLNVARAKGRDARRLADITEIQLGLELYDNANNHYPASLDQLVPADIPQIPVDPESGSYDYYSCATNTYHLGTSLEDQTNPALTTAAHQAPMCPQDPIQGNPTQKCTPADAGSYCYDLDQSSGGLPPSNTD